MAVVVVVVMVVVVVVVEVVVVEVVGERSETLPHSVTSPVQLHSQ